MKKAALLVALLIISFSYATGGEEVIKEVKEQTEQWVDAQFTGVKSFSKMFEFLYRSFGGGQACEAPFPASRAQASWLIPTGMVLILIGIVIGLAIMAGEALQLPGLVAMAKDELYHLGTTLWRLSVIITLISSSQFWFEFSSSSTADPIYAKENTYIDAAMSASRLIYGEMAQMTGTLLLFNYYLYQIFSITFPLGTNPRTMYTFDLGPIVKPFIDFIGTVLQTIAMAMVEWLLHLILLCFIKKYLWSVFIPLGILFRAFPPTRNMGEGLLAIMLALALIYPVMILITYESHKILRFYMIDPSEIGLLFSETSGYIFAIFSIFALVFLTGVFFPFFVGTVIGLMIDIINNSVYYTVFLGLFMPFIAVFVTLTAAKEFAKFFQVDVNFFSFLRII